MKIQTISPNQAAFGNLRKFSAYKTAIPALMLALAPIACTKNTESDRFESQVEAAEQNPDSVRIAKNYQVLHDLSSETDTNGLVRYNINNSRILHQLYKENRINPNFTISRKTYDSYLIKTKYEGNNIIMTLKADEKSGENMHYAGKITLLNDTVKSSAVYDYDLRFSPKIFGKYEVQLKSENFYDKITVRSNFSDDKIFIENNYGDIHELKIPKDTMELINSAQAELSNSESGQASVNQEQDDGKSHDWMKIIVFILGLASGFFISKMSSDIDDNCGNGNMHEPFNSF